MHERTTHMSDAGEVVNVGEEGKKRPISRHQHIHTHTQTNTKKGEKNLFQNYMKCVHQCCQRTSPQSIIITSHPPWLLRPMDDIVLDVGGSSYFTLVYDMKLHKTTAASSVYVAIDAWAEETSIMGMKTSSSSSLSLSSTHTYLEHWTNSRMRSTCIAACWWGGMGWQKKNETTTPTVAHAILHEQQHIADDECIRRRK